MADVEDEDQARDLPEEWSTDSNDCFHITLLRADGSEHANFQPSFTYPIFGDKEAIFGYQGLEIELTFAAHSLEPRIHISHDAIFPEQGDIKATDIPAALADFLTAEAFLDTRLTFTDAATYKPPGEKIRTYRVADSTYEVWCSSMADAAAKRLLQRMQVLVPLFIEGGTMLQLEQDWVTNRWKLFTSWAVGLGGTAYSLIGYGTSYQVFAVEKSSATPNIATDADEPDFLSATALARVSSPLELPSRSRLSQFLILPDFQGGGHGQTLYRSMYQRLCAPSNIREFTVEDPNESFDDLRDLCDLTYLRARNAEFAALEVNTAIPDDVFRKHHPIPLDQIISQAVRDNIRSTTKLETRQFNRLVEMQTLSKIPAGNRSRNRTTRREKTKNLQDKQYYLWRLYVKQRLLIFNEDALRQLEHTERVDKLEAAVDSNQEHYVEMIEKVLKHEAKGIDFEGEGIISTTATAKRKRKVIDDDEDEDEVGSDTSKRSKLG